MTSSEAEEIIRLAAKYCNQIIVGCNFSSPYLDWDKIKLDLGLTMIAEYSLTKTDYALDKVLILDASRCL